MFRAKLHCGFVVVSQPFFTASEQFPLLGTSKNGFLVSTAASKRTFCNSGASPNLAAPVFPLDLGGEISRGQSTGRSRRRRRARGDPAGAGAVLEASGGTEGQRRRADWESGGEWRRQVRCSNSGMLNPGKFVGSSGFCVGFPFNQYRKGDRLGMSAVCKSGGSPSWRVFVEASKPKPHSKRFGVHRGIWVPFLKHPGQSATSFVARIWIWPS